MFKFCRTIKALEPVIVDDLAAKENAFKQKLEIEKTAFQQKLDAETSRFNTEVERLKQRVEIVESCSKAEIMHLRLTFQEDINEKNTEIKGLKLKLRHLINKTEIR